MDQAHCRCTAAPANELGDPAPGSRCTDAVNRICRSAGCPAISGKTPVSSNRRNCWSSPVAAIARPTAATGCLLDAGNRASPRESHDGHEERDHTEQERRCKSDWTEPQKPGRCTISRREAPDELDRGADGIRVGLHAWRFPPRLAIVHEHAPGSRGQARSRSSNKMNANNNAAPLYNTQ